MIVLDTHAWIWWIDDSSRLSREVRDRIDAEDDVRVCGISLLEIATAVALGRLTLRPSAQQWIEIAQSPSQLRVEPLTGPLCLESVQLPGTIHRDPADRLIVALSRQLNAPLVTADTKLLAYSHVSSIAASA
jgi:PIN domain nuclease of toxin-antitoxin system